MGPVTMSLCPIKIEKLLEPEVRKSFLYQHSVRGDPTFLPIHLSGGIGDVIMSIDGLKELQKKYQIAVYTPHIQALRYFYKEPLSVFAKIHNFTWHIEYSLFSRFIFHDGFYRFLIDSHEEFYLKHLEFLNTHPRMEYALRYGLDRYFLFSLFGKENGWDRRDLPMKFLGHKNKITVTQEPRAEKANYITIHDGYDNQNYKVSGRSTKTWNWTYWNDLVKGLKKDYPQYEIYQLGTSTARPIDGVDHNLINKTTITEAFNILKHSVLHIDGDSGFVHAAKRLSVPCVVLWGPTPQHFYGYEDNINLTAHVCAETCYGVRDNWNDKCVLGYPAPKCMDEILPEQVLEAIRAQI